MTRKSKGGRKATARKAHARPIRTQVPAGQLAQIIAKSREYTQSLVIPVYPEPSTGDFPQLDFKSSSLVQVGPLQAANRGKGKGKPVASPQQVHAEIKKALAKMPLAGNDGPLVIGEQNAEFGNASKASYYAAAYTEIVTRHHLLFWEEVDFNFLQTVAKANNLKFWCSKQNSRGQAVGFLWNERLKMVSYDEWHEVANVQGVPDLRPALVLTFRDTTTGFVFTAIVVHLKSMRGGPVVTAPIRYQQCQILANKIQANGLTNVILGGDWNFFVNTGTDAQPLTSIGAKLVYPGDTTSTQAMGGRLDAFYTYKLACKLGAYKVRNWWKIQSIGRSFTDHGLLSTRTFNLVPCTPGSMDPDCQPGSPGPDDDQNTDVVTG